MTWGDLFDRAAGYDVTVDDVRNTLRAHRAARTGDASADDGGDDER